MIRNSLETIEYIDRIKYQIIYKYKERNRSQGIRDKNLWIVVRKLFEIMAGIDMTADIKEKIEKKYRKRIIIKCLNQLTSDSYIESRIDWNEFNNINNMLDNIDLDEIETDVYKNIDTTICNRCC